MTSSCGSTTRSGRVAQPDRGQQAALQDPAAGLLVDVQRGLLVPSEHPLGTPLPEQVGGVRVAPDPSPAAPPAGIAWQDQPDHVVRVELLQVGGVVRVDHVVRRAGDGRQVADRAGHVAQAAERCHQQRSRGLIGGEHGEDATCGRRSDDEAGRGPGGDRRTARRDGVPAGEVYDWYVRGTTLLESGNPEAAAELLGHAHRREPESASVLEALARALFDARRYAEAAGRFTELVEVSPDSDYARFGLGLSRMRLDDLAGADRAAGTGHRDAPRHAPTTSRRCARPGRRSAPARTRPAAAASTPAATGPAARARPSERPAGRGVRRPLATRHDVALLDLDGVLYVGPDAVPGAPEAVADAAAAGMRPAYVTNNAARTPATVAAPPARARGAGRRGATS